MDQDPARAAAAAALQAPELAGPLAQGAPALVLAADPPRLVLANAAAVALFEARDEETLALRVAAASEPAFTRLMQLNRSLRPGAPPRRERLPVAGTSILFSLIRRAGSPPLLVGVGLEQAVQSPQAAPAEPPHAVPGSESSVREAMPAVTPDPRSHEEVAADLARRFGQAPVIRFLWQTDAQDQLVALSGPLSEILRMDPASLLGRSLFEVAREAGADPLDSLVQALAGRQTWSHLELAWPIFGTGAAVAIGLGGAPLRQGSDFAGYRGFGVIHLQRVTPRGPGPELEEATADANPPAPTESLPTEPAAQRPPAPAVGEAEESGADLRPEPPEPQAEPTPAAAQDAAPGRPAAPGTNVVQLRPHRSTGSLTELSPSERNAFREIARALGARPETREQRPARPTPTPVEPPAAAPETPEEVANTPGIPPNPRVRDLIEIASRARSLAEDMAADLDEGRGEDTQDQPSETPELGSTAHHEDEPEWTEPFAEAPAATADPIEATLSQEARALIDRLPVGVLISRLEIPIFLNRTLLDLLGYETADAFHEAGGLEQMFRGRSPELLAESAAGGAIPLVTRSGEVVAAEARVQAIAWEGDPATMICLRPSREAENLARLRATEQDLRGREAELREVHAILDTATDGVALIDDQGKLLSMNRAAQALFGYEPNELVGEPFTTLFVRESHDLASDYLAGLRSSGVASVMNDGREVMGRARQGGSIPLFLTLGRVTAGGSNKFCLVLRDMTSWKKAERELNEARRQAERASALKSDFLAKVSHEIRTPLNAILGFAEVIMEERFGPVGNERYKDYLKDIHASGTHVMSLVNDLLDLSKIEAGRMELNFGAVDANRIVSECVSLMQPQAARDRVIIRTSLAQHLPNIVADERSLRQIVLNLLSNAVKYNEPGGQVIVSTALTDAGHAVIRIRDTGIGMTEAETQIALEPFRQLATARVSGGTGLGLPLTKALVEANRASFTIKSKKKEGTLIEVAFPSTRVLAE